MKQKLQTLCFTLLLLFYGGATILRANAAGISIPQEAGSYISMSEAETAGALSLTNCRVDGTGDGFVIGSTGINSVITLKMNNSAAGNYILSFMSGAQNLEATVKVEVTSGDYKRSKSFNIANTGSWTPVEFHCMELDNLPAGEVMMKLSVTSTTGSYAGNYGKFCVAGTSYYDPIGSIDLTKGEYSQARYESDVKGVGYCNDGSTAAYTAYNSANGDATLNIGLKYSSDGTITVMVTDAFTETVELTKVLDITKDICKSLTEPTQFPLGYLTHGLKKIKFIMNTKGNYLCNYHNVGISVVSSLDVQVGSTGFATVGFPYAVTLPDGVRGYAVTNVTETAVTLTEVAAGTNIAANTGLIIVAAPGSYTFPVVESGVEIADNVLVANTEADKIAETEGEFYVLAVTDEASKTVGLAQIAQGGVIAKNRAYMPASVVPAGVSGQTSSLRLVFGNPTAVEEVAENGVEPVETVVYNLAGQRVRTDAKGMVIVKGRKYLKK